MITKTCKTCGKDFTVDKEEAEWFKEHELQQPKHCLECRRKRKAFKQSQDARGNIIMANKL